MCRTLQVRAIWKILTSFHPVRGNDISPPISLSFAHAHYAHACGATWIIWLARRERIDLTSLRAFKARELRTHFVPIITAVESVICEFRWNLSIFSENDIALHKSFDYDRIFHLQCHALLIVRKLYFNKTQLSQIFSRA